MSGKNVSMISTVSTAGKRIEKLRYMHQNPVKRGTGRGAGAMAGS